jgi:hypothetical protein
VIREVEVEEWEWEREGGREDDGGGWGGAGVGEGRSGKAREAEVFGVKHKGQRAINRAVYGLTGVNESTDARHV